MFLRDNINKKRFKTRLSKENVPEPDTRNPTDNIR